MNNNPMALLIFGLILLIIMIAVGVAITRWVLRIDTIVSNQEKQLADLDELVKQNERIIKILEAK